MRNTKFVIKCLLAAVSSVTAIAASPAWAQSQPRFYLGGGIGSFAVDADEVDGRSFSTTVAGGVRVARHIDIEIDVAFPTETFTRSYTGPSVSFALPGASSAERDRLTVVTRFDKSRDVTSSVSAVAVIRPTLGRRVTPAIIVGVTNQRVQDRTTYTPVFIPEGVDPQHPAVIAREESATRNIGGPTIGAQVAFAITPALAIVPDLRYDYASIGDEINNTLRTSGRLQWRF